MPDSASAGPAGLAAVVLAGGRAARLGGADKPALVVGGQPLLATVLSAATAAGAGQIVIARHPGRDGFWLVKRAVRRDGDGWWLESDNPGGGAVDSRRFGAVPVALIEGRVLTRYWRPRSG